MAVGDSKGLPVARDHKETEQRKADSQLAQVFIITWPGGALQQKWSQGSREGALQNTLLLLRISLASRFLLWLAG